ncbi:hypothetical protein IM792_15495 [Mucilaginibacter sp. JRF]|uniref:helix-turn-helix domain-containing protein n=1 Tax=Mucilaginibacter sp. JRF TaxID=2780088 RepID=UPI00187FB23B|nr:helix-turn-helix domain-containing protein [Mucilaginibacter sp. JRF]MBE9585860.1 hypothetical protein [Mucilaginibacter sp. JRF]
MHNHYGKTVEYIIRRKGVNLSDLAKIMNINRRTFYNWFNQARLKKEIIIRIGAAIKYDFSAEFPHLVTPPEQPKSLIPKAQPSDDDHQNNNWKDKYISLLEEYNQALIDTLSYTEKKPNANND